MQLGEIIYSLIQELGLRLFFEGLNVLGFLSTNKWIAQTW